MIKTDKNHHFLLSENKYVLIFSIFQNCLDMKTFSNVMKDRPSSEDGEFVKFIKKYSGANL